MVPPLKLSDQGTMTSQATGYEGLVTRVLDTISIGCSHVVVPGDRGEALGGSEHEEGVVVPLGSYSLFTHSSTTHSFKDHLELCPTTHL